MQGFLIILGLGGAPMPLAAILWSIAFHDRRYMTAKTLHDTHACPCLGANIHVVRGSHPAWCLGLG